MKGAGNDWGKRKCRYFCILSRETWQGRIHDFPAGAPTPKWEHANLLFGKIFLQVHKSDKIWTER